MANMLPPVFATLSTSPAVTAIVAQRIYRTEAPQDKANPYVTWFASITPEINLSDPPPTDRVLVQVDCWHQSDLGVQQLARAVRDAMEGVCHMTGITVDLREPETGLYRMSLQFDWWHDRQRTV